MIRCLALSFQYNVPIEEIYALNGLNAQSILSIGQQIIIKAGHGHDGSGGAADRGSALNRRRLRRKPRPLRGEADAVPQPADTTAASRWRRPRQCAHASG